MASVAKQASNERATSRWLSVGEETQTRDIGLITGRILQPDI